LERDEAVPASVLSGLIYGWNNHYSVKPEDAEVLLNLARSTDGPILECGSGLSTILLGLVAARNGNKVWSLEQKPWWAERVRSTLKRHRYFAAQHAMIWLKRLPTDTSYVRIESGYLTADQAINFSRDAQMVVFGQTVERVYQSIGGGCRLIFK
jgi:hypothetical protein